MTSELMKEDEAKYFENSFQVSKRFDLTQTKMIEENAKFEGCQNLDQHQCETKYSERCKWQLSKFRGHGYKCLDRFCEDAIDEEECANTQSCQWFKNTCIKWNLDLPQNYKIKFNENEKPACAELKSEDMCRADDHCLWGKYFGDKRTEKCCQKCKIYPKKKCNDLDSCAWREGSCKIYKTPERNTCDMCAQVPEGNKCVKDRTFKNHNNLCYIDENKNLQKDIIGWCEAFSCVTCNIHNNEKDCMKF
jgi:hypothetical protein